MQDGAAEWIRDRLNGETMEIKSQGMAALACIAASARETALQIAQQQDIVEEVSRFLTFRGLLSAFPQSLHCLCTAFP